LTSKGLTARNHAGAGIRRLPCLFDIPGELEGANGATSPGNRVTACYIRDCFFIVRHMQRQLPSLLSVYINLSVATRARSSATQKSLFPIISVSRSRRALEYSIIYKSQVADRSPHYQSIIVPARYQIARLVSLSLDLRFTLHHLSTSNHILTLTIARRDS